MTLWKHELKLSRISLLIWTASIAFLIVICIFMFPEMEDQMDSVSDMFASMGSFSQAFGMDRLNFGEFMGFYGVECGNILGLGGAFFAAFTGILALAKEEKEHTAEFLLTHPISRTSVFFTKYLSLLTQIVLLNLIFLILSVLSAQMVGEEIPWKEFMLFHLAYFIMQIETGSICFSISAFLHRSGLGIGIGLASMLYFLNIIANLTEDAKWLKYLTPFGYTEGADIITECALDWKMIAVGIACAVVFLIIAFLKYNKKDIS